MLKNLKYILRQVYESLVFALNSIVINKMRTLLSLLGITIGIFAIIAVYTAIDTLEGYVRHSVESISSNIISVGKWPWTEEEEEGSDKAPNMRDYKWWKYMNRPDVTEAEMRDLQQMMPQIKEASMNMSFNRIVKYERNYKDQVNIVGGSELYLNTQSAKIAEGRAFSDFEYTYGSNSCIIGAQVAEDLFDKSNPVGKNIKIGNHKVDVVGVFVKEGSSAFGQSWDDRILLSLNYAKTIAVMKNSNPSMNLIPRQGVDIKEFKALAASRMRAIRRLAPTAESNFAINDVSTVTKQLDSIFVMINLAGGVIGMFSILVGAFGIANIMFVSVRERTAQIGIQKALGARPFAILLQFTIEAVLLSIVGGILGLFLIWIGTLIVTPLIGFEVTLSLGNVLIGLGISAAVGAVSGIFPAYSASRLDPVVAISKNA